VKRRSWCNKSIPFSESPFNTRVLLGRFKPHVFPSKTLSLGIDEGEESKTPKKEGRGMVSLELLLGPVLAMDL